MLTFNVTTDIPEELFNTCTKEFLIGTGVTYGLKLYRDIGKVIDYKANRAFIGCISTYNNHEGLIRYYPTDKISYDEEEAIRVGEHIVTSIASEVLRELHTNRAKPNYNNELIRLFKVTDNFIQIAE